MTETTNQPAEQESIFTEADFDTRKYDRHIRNARTSIFVIAGVYTLGIIIGYASSNAEFDWFAFSIDAIVVALFIALGFWTKYKPYTAIISALVLYILVIALSAIDNPVNIVKGIILKIAIIVYLITGIRNAKEAQHWKEIAKNK